MIIKLEEKQIELFSLWYEYLYPYLLRFSLKENIKWEDNIIYVNNKDREQFIEMLKNILIELMDECYVEPSHKDRSKYSSRYKKIEIQEHIYILNYRTDTVGIIGYGLNSLIEVISNS